MPTQKIPMYAHLIAALVISLFVPSGVMVFVAGNLFAQSLLLLIPGFGVAEEVEAPQPPAPPEPEPDPEPVSPPISSIPEPPSPAPAPRVPFDVSLFGIKTTIIDLVPLEWGGLDQNSGEEASCLLLDEDGDLLLAQNMKVIARKTLPLDQPLGIHRLGENEFLVVGREGKIVRVNRQGDSFSLQGEIETPQEISAFAVNSFGTLLAYLTPGSSQLSGMFLEAERDQVLARDLDSPTRLAFAENSRHLAVGSETGFVSLVDIATRKIENRLEDAALAASPIDHLRAGPEGTWVTVNEEKTLARWSREGELTHSRLLPSYAHGFDVAGQGGQVAFGSSAGFIRIRTFDFSEEIFKENIHQGTVKKIILHEMGRVLISFDDKNFAHRVNLIDYPA